MATKRKAQAEGLRRCIGSVKFGIEAHDAPVGDFPVQPSQKDGLGRMCKPHWREYTTALRRASTPPKAAPASIAEVDRATSHRADAKGATTGKAKPAAKRGTNAAAKTSRKAAEAVAPAEEAVASARDPDAAEQDAILVERRQRVKAWRKSELEGTAAEA